MPKDYYAKIARRMERGEVPEPDDVEKRMRMGRVPKPSDGYRIGAIKSRYDGETYNIEVLDNPPRGYRSINYESPLRPGKILDDKRRAARCAAQFECGYGKEAIIVERRHSPHYGKKKRYEVFVKD